MSREERVKENAVKQISTSERCRGRKGGRMEDGKKRETGKGKGMKENKTPLLLERVNR